MKIAFVFIENEKREIGDCLSSAQVFGIYDDTAQLIKDLDVSSLSKQERFATKAAQLLAKNGVDYVVGRDFGPKAKAAIEEFGMHWYLASNNQYVDEIITIINKKK